MAVETIGDGGFVVTGKQDVSIFMLIALKGALKLETKGMKCRGESAFSKTKRLLGLERVTKEQALRALSAYIEACKAARG